MARPLRIEFPGAFCHVMNRGNTGMNIYRSARDREKFLEYVCEEEFSPGCGDLSLQGIDGGNQRRLGPSVRYFRSWNRGST